VGPKRYIFSPITMFRMVWNFLPGWSSPPKCGPLMSIWRHIYKNSSYFFVKWILLYCLSFLLWL